MCEESFLERIKNDHELHMVIISFISYYFSKNMLNSVVIGVSIYVFMKSIERTKTQKVKLDHIYKNMF